MPLRTGQRAAASYNGERRGEGKIVSTHRATATPSRGHKLAPRRTPEPSHQGAAARDQTRPRHRPQERLREGPQADRAGPGDARARPRAHGLRQEHVLGQHPGGAGLPPPGGGPGGDGPLRPAARRARRVLPRGAPDLPDRPRPGDPRFRRQAPVRDRRAGDDHSPGVRRRRVRHHQLQPRARAHRHDVRLDGRDGLGAPVDRMRRAVALRHAGAEGNVSAAHGDRHAERLLSF